MSDARNVHILSNAVQLVETGRNAWLATIPSGHTLDDLSGAEYWTHKARDFRPVDKIYCWWEDGSCYAELLVIGRTNTAAQTALLMHKDLRSEGKVFDFATELSKYTIEFAGPANGWRVVRKSDREVIKGEFGDENAAKQWVVAFVSAPPEGWKAVNKEPPPAQTALKDKKAA